MKIAFELHADDLRHFRLIMREARKAAAMRLPEAIVGGARRLIDQIRQRGAPVFVIDRLVTLEQMIDMLADHQWRLPESDAARVLNTLAYFCEPEDLIPDHVPGLGFLDDAIMIELAAGDLRHELEAYRDFCEFRRSRPPRRGVKPKASESDRDDWLEQRRSELQRRMHERRSEADEADGQP